MYLVDAQIHIWSTGQPTPAKSRATYSMAEAIADMDAAGVAAAVLHPPSWDPDANVIAERAAQAHPTRFGILGHLPPKLAASRERLAGWKQRPGMLGVRFTFV